MVTSHLRGHPIEYVNEQWVYCDTKESTVENWESRPCGYCNMMATPEGHDACIANLPNVMNACCGHGSCADAYVQFEGNTILQGKNAIEHFNSILEDK